MGSRRIARQYALMILYGIDLSEDLPEKAVSNFWQALELDEELAADERPLSKRSPQVSERAFAEMLVQGVCGKIVEIDNEIDRSSMNWSLSRMATAERNILRIGVFELLFKDDIPIKVSINEAIEMAKIFCESNAVSKRNSAPQFINGVLDNISRR